MNLNNYTTAIITGKQTMEMVTLETKHPNGSQVRVRVTHCAICTLEQRIYSGVIARYPYAGGHEVAGIVEEIGRDVKTLRPGDKVVVRLLNACGVCHYCRSGHENQCETAFKVMMHRDYVGPGGFGQEMVTDVRNVFPMPAETPLVQAALAEPLACCVHSIQKANIRLGEDVVVIGCGMMGALHIRLAKMRGARVIACETNKRRLQIAKQQGADLLVDSGIDDSVQCIMELTQNRGADVVLCTAAHPSAAEESVRMAAKLGRIILYSSFHPAQPIGLDVNRVHSTEMVITGAVNPDIRDFQTACRLLGMGLIDVSGLITDVIPLADWKRAFTLAMDPESYRVILACS